MTLGEVRNAKNFFQIRHQGNWEINTSKQVLMKNAVFSLQSVKSEIKKVGMVLTGVVILLMILTVNGRAYAQGAGNEEFDDLMSNVHPAIYIINGEYSVYGEGAPQVLFCDVQSLQQLNTSNPDFASVRLIKVKVKSGQNLSSISLASLPDFQSLKYFAVTFQYDACGNMTPECLDALAGQSIQTEGTDVSLYTFLSIPN